MYQPIEINFRNALAAFIRENYAVEVNVVTERPPRLEMGEIASPVCFELAKRLKRAPRQIAQEIAQAMNSLAAVGVIRGVARCAVAGGGYVNAFLDRAAFFRAACRLAGHENIEAGADAPKAIVEHTAINPNKAAHIGHLRNAAIGDTFVRLLRHAGHRVEVQNYIDNTGVQVADVVLGFIHLEKKSLDEVRAIAAQSRFDYYCWDLYARVTQFLAEDKTRLALRGQVMKEIEEGHGPVAEMADFVSTTILHAHLATMDRLGIDYDLLSRESEILGMKFWDAAFQMLKERGAIRLATSGKQAGCWIMPLGDTPESESETAEEGVAEAKIIVRSNGTVTYVGKDIAYHLWKFGLLDRDFHYARFHKHPDGHVAWVTTMGDAEKGAPAFGKGHEVYNVIDSRQKYPQQVVREGLRALGFTDQADHLVHIAYDVVGFTPRCAAELGYTITEEDAKRPYIEMSGRRGQGVKADDLLDEMKKHALAEVDARHRDFSEVERDTTAGAIAIGALRYFLLKYTRTAIIAFDFKDALSFEGETGPYVQYAVVRVNGILRKGMEQNPGYDVEGAGIRRDLEAGEIDLAPLLQAPNDDIWEIVLLAGSLGARIEAAIAAQEPAFVAKYAFELAQAFNVFYHKHHILSESDRVKRVFLLRVALLVKDQLVAALALLGVSAPEKM
ncbi:MAG TPA: arginine--tRNA ligase [Candidatus Acidoferrales bacterium]|nr:arginine--tRNA ligase [Candidatus Acidoferrales bacterium]